MYDFIKEISLCWCMDAWMMMMMHGISLMCVLCWNWCLRTVLHVIAEAAAPCMTALGKGWGGGVKLHATCSLVWMYRCLCVHGGNEHELVFSVSVLRSHIISRLQAFLRLVPHDLSLMFNAGFIVLWWFVDHCSNKICVFTTAQMFSNLLSNATTK